MGQARSHRKSWDVDWDVHCLTFSTFQQQPFFRSRQTAGWFLDALDAARRSSPFHLFSYVVMPEHVHLVLQPLPGVRMRRVLWQVKRPLTAKVLAWVRRQRPELLKRMADVQPDGKVSYRFWQRGGGYDRNLRSAGDVHEKIGYIHDNPVKRGYVDDPTHWRYSSARNYAGLPGLLDVTVVW